MEDDLIALFDMDGTLVDYDGGMLESLQSLQSEYEPPLTFERMHNLPPAWERRRKLICKVPGWWLNLRELQLGFDVLNWAVEYGFQPDILTKGPLYSPNAWKEKVEWCQNHVTPYYEDFGMNVVTEKSRLYGRVLVDDFPPYIYNWAKKRPRGLVVMPAHCYNKVEEIPTKWPVENDDWDTVLSNIIRFDGTNQLQVRKALIVARNREILQNVDYHNA